MLSYLTGVHSDKVFYPIGVYVVRVRFVTTLGWMKGELVSHVCFGEVNEIKDADRGEYVGTILLHILPTSPPSATSPYTCYSREHILEY